MLDKFGRPLRKLDTRPATIKRLNAMVQSANSGRDMVVAMSEVEFAEYIGVRPDTIDVLKDIGALNSPKDDM